MKRKILSLTALALASTLSLSACARAGEDTGSTADGEATKVSLWTHSAGNEQELKVYNQIISDFNSSQDEFEVVSESFPQGAYNDAIVAAAASNDLPCLLDMDGPIVPNWAWAGYIQPLELSSDTTDKLLPTAMGVWKDQIYSAGYWDAAIAIFARKSVLEENSIRIPTAESPWTKDEFDSALRTLQTAGYETVIDLGAEDTGEWWPYAFSPFLQSFGGDLIDRDSMTTAEGALNGPEAVAWGEWFQGLFAEGLASNTGTVGNEEFNRDEVALSYTGVWNAFDSLEAAGDDLLILPPPDLGQGPKIGGGSWQWGISSSCSGSALEGARAYLEFSFDDEYITAFADNQIVIPATEGATDGSKYFSPEGELRPFSDFMQFAVLRPETPAYAVISTTFQTAGMDIMNGADVKTTLDQAVKDIDADIQNNDGYGFN